MTEAGWLALRVGIGYSVAPLEVAMSYTILYFSPRGRPEPIRLTLAHAGVPFEDKFVPFDQWPATKATLPLGQMPVLIVRDADGERHIPQSMAILRHLARVHGQYGKTEAEHLAADIAADTANDLRGAFSSLRFSPAWSDEAGKAKYIEQTAPVHFARLAKLLGDRAWFAADGPTFADFVAFDALDTHESVWPDALGAWPTLAAFAARVRALASLKDYLARR